VAYDEELAERVREVLASRSGVEERSMFGSLCFMVDGNLAVCARKGGDLLVRMEPEDAAEASAEEGVEIAEMGPRRRRMKGWVFVSPERISEDAELAEWVDIGADFASTLPPK